jgi:hypothetical protein
MSAADLFPFILVVTSEAATVQQNISNKDMPPITQADKRSTSTRVRRKDV